MVVAVCGMFGVSSMSAQTAAEIKATETKMMNPKTLCNQGSEAFSTFIAKFSTDKEFMESRIKLDDSMKEKYAEIMVPETFTIKEPTERDGDMWYQAWGELQYQKVYLDCGWVDSFSEYTLEFNRIGEKWYLARIVED